MRDITGGKIVTTRETRSKVGRPLCRPSKSKTGNFPSMKKWTNLLGIGNSVLLGCDGPIELEEIARALKGMKTARPQDVTVYRRNG